MVCEYEQPQQSINHIYQNLSNTYDSKIAEKGWAEVAHCGVGGYCFLDVALK